MSSADDRFALARRGWALLNSWRHGEQQQQPGIKRQARASAVQDFVSDSR
ncbi:MAG: hypothetical protein QMC73_04265 [Myxococcota bacterium]